MGKNNRQRRADKHRRRERQRAGMRDRFAYLEPRDLAEILAFDAAEAAEHGEAERLEEQILRLEGFGSIGRTAMTATLVTSLRTAWECGWQPIDIARSASKRLGASYAELAAEIITLEARTGGAARTSMPEAWSSQLRELDRKVRDDEERWAGTEGLVRGASLLGLLSHLPVLPKLIPVPSEWGRRDVSQRREAPGVDTRVLDRVRALLAKAESTEFVEEADALTVKAQELMARFSIDRAMVVGESCGEEPKGRRIGVDDPHARGKASLLASIAAANRCRAVWSEGYGFSTVVGFASEIDIVEVLYVSLLVQATRSMTAAGTVRDSSGKSRTRSFRQSFMFSYARRIGERLEVAIRGAEDAAGAEHGDRLLPVLAGRASAVTRAFDALFPDLTLTSSHVSSMAGWAAGRAAADLAHLGPEGQLLPGIAV